MDKNSFEQNTFRFQVNMGGIIDLFSQHLYSSPKVFVRELLQNAVDAVTARSIHDISAPRTITVSLVDDEVPPRIEVADKGTGLTLEEIHRFLSIIGESSKRENMANDDFIGRFGVGLLSGFLVSDELKLYTRSAKSDKGYLWQAHQNGTYSIEEADVKNTGSTVVLSCKKGYEEYFTKQTLEELLQHYGDILPYPVYFKNKDYKKLINEVSPPWLTPVFSSPSEILNYGEKYFGESFMGYIPLKSEAAGIDGVAYIINRRVNPGAGTSGRVYLRNMLLTEAGKGLLPDWAFFLKVMVNAQNLRPTASREDFYQDELLEKTSQELGNTVKNYIKKMAASNPQFINKFIDEHSLALKSLAVDDEEILTTFIDFFPFETSMGHYTFGELKKLAPVIKYVPVVDQFRQLTSIFSASGRLIVNGGYVYDAEILESVNSTNNGIRLEKIRPEDALFELDDLSAEETSRFSVLLQKTTEAMKKRDCIVSVKKFKPEELPAIILVSDEASFISDLKYSKEATSDLFADLLENIEKNFNSANTAFCLNAANPLVKKLATNALYDEDVINLLYVQSMLLARRPLRSDEMSILNTGIINLIEKTL